jgi:hypothetical protein
MREKIVVLQNQATLSIVVPVPLSLNGFAAGDTYYLMECAVSGERQNLASIGVVGSVLTKVCGPSSPPGLPVMVSVDSSSFPER